ncbi:MAG: hypothetical protein M3131_03090 [Actinomycetota bacterium]|nr:hypothetical protein [Actinomycetota bacterium]
MSVEIVHTMATTNGGLRGPDCPSLEPQPTRPGLARDRRAVEAPVERAADQAICRPAAGEPQKVPTLTRAC